MFPRAFLPDAALEIEEAEIEVGTGRIRVKVRNIEGEAVCPCCGKRAKRIHSGYERHLHDVPCGGFAVEIVLKVRRFFCDAAHCHKALRATNQSVRRCCAVLGFTAGELDGQART